MLIFNNFTKTLKNIFKDVQNILKIFEIASRLKLGIQNVSKMVLGRYLPTF